MNRVPRRPSQAELDGMSHAEKDALIFQLFDLLEGLEQRLQVVERRLGKNSRNSSLPPSSDGFKRQAAQPRQPGTRPSGGQVGHTGVTLTWSPMPDEVVSVAPTGTCGCGRSLAEAPGEVGEKRQQIESPEPKVRVTEYRQVVVTCACGCRYAGEFPIGVAPHVSYGPRLKAYAVGLVQGHFVALARSAEIIADQYGVRPSNGSVQRWVVQLAGQLEPRYAATGQALAVEPVAHFDESGLRVNGKTQWLHVAGTATLAYYTVHAKRGREAMDAAGILPRFTGVAVHDHWGPYFGYRKATHSLCNAHILRELRYFEETTEGQRWPVRLREILVEGKQAVEAARAEGLTAVDPATVAQLLSRYDAWVETGLIYFPERSPEPGGSGRVKQTPATNLLRRLRDFKPQLWRFLRGCLETPITSHEAQGIGRSYDENPGYPLHAASLEVLHSNFQTASERFPRAVRQQRGRTAGAAGEGQVESRRRLPRLRWCGGILHPALRLGNRKAPRP